MPVGSLRYLSGPHKLSLVGSLWQGGRGLGLRTYESPISVGPLQEGSHSWRSLHTLLPFTIGPNMTCSLYLQVRVGATWSRVQHQLFWALPCAAAEVQAAQGEGSP